MIPPKQKAPEGALANSNSQLERAFPPARGRGPRVSRLGGARFSGFPEQGKTVDYSRFEPPSGEKIRSGMDGSRRNPVLIRASGKPGRHLYSRDFPHLPFTPASVNLGPLRASSLTRPGAFARIRSFSGQFVGELAARRFKSKPINTHRTSSPNDVNAVPIS